MNARILFVDDEPNILSAFQRQLRQFAITTASSGEMGLQAISDGPPFAVVVSDLRMPGMDGSEFLARVKQASPDTVRIMLTGQADLSAVAEAVNEGNIFRFLLKPCPANLMASAVEAALEQHRLVNAEKDLLEKTLKGMIEVLSEILSMVNPEAFGRAYRMRDYVRHLSAKLRLADEWQYEIAAMLSQIGSIAVPQEIIDKVHLAQPLTREERKTYETHFQVSHDLIARIPRLNMIAEMVLHHGPITSPPNGNPTLDPRMVGSDMLRLAADFDDLVTRGATYNAATAKLRTSGQHHPALVAALETLAERESETEIRAIMIADLRPGMRVFADVHSKKGLLLLSKGQEITPSVIARLKGFPRGPAGIAEPLTVVARRQITPDAAPS